MILETLIDRAATFDAASCLPMVWFSIALTTWLSRRATLRRLTLPRFASSSPLANPRSKFALQRVQLRFPG